MTDLRSLGLDQAEYERVYDELMATDPPPQGGTHHRRLHFAYCAAWSEYNRLQSEADAALERAREATRAVMENVAAEIRRREQRTIDAANDARINAKIREILAGRKDER